MRNVITFPDPQALANDAASRFAAIASQAIGARGVFSVALAGGSTPKMTYSLLATSRIDRNRMGQDSVLLGR